MAAIVEMNDIYEGLGFTPAAVAQLSGAQGVDNLIELSLLTNSKVDSI